MSRVTITDRHTDATHTGDPCERWRKRHRSHVQYLYIENPPELKWDGERWVEKQNANCPDTSEKE
jgi:hypothetical protein